jgi:hypothetical protein
MAERVEKGKTRRLGFGVKHALRTTSLPVGCGWFVINQIEL